MKNESFIFFTITYEINNFKNADNLLNNYYSKKLILSIETILRTTPFPKISFKSSGPSISEKIPLSYRS